MTLNEIRAIVSDDARDGKIVLTQRIDVEDEAGTLVHRMRFVDAIEIILPPDEPLD
jgi:hypothetical protein